MSNPNARPRSYTLSRWSAECVTHFINFGYVGALWGCFNPMSSGQYGKLTRPGPYYYGATVGSIVFVSKVVSGGVAVARNRDDALVRYHIMLFFPSPTLHDLALCSSWLCQSMLYLCVSKQNELFGFGAVATYWWKVLSSDTRILWNNRFVGGAFASAAIYANVA